MGDGYKQLYNKKCAQLLTNLHKEMSEKSFGVSKIQVKSKSKTSKSYKIKKEKNIDIGCNKNFPRRYGDIFCYKNEDEIDCSFNKFDIGFKEKGIIKEM